MGVLLSVRLPFSVTTSAAAAAFAGRAAAFRGGPAASPTPADCGDIVAAAGGADEVGVVEGVRSQSVLRPRSRRRRRRAGADRSGRTGPRPAVRRRRRLGRP